MKMKKIFFNIIIFCSNIIMCKTKHVLRLTNTSYGNEQPTLNADKNAVSIRLPAHLRNKGRCNVKVIEISVSLRNGNGSRVIANGTHIVAMRSNIHMLGHSNENNGFNQILGSGIVPDNNTNAVQLDSSEALEFTCPSLPDVIELERMCYDPANSFNLIAANNFTTNVVPFQVVLEITFDEEHDNK